MSDWMQFTSTMIQILAWPVAILVVVLVLRREMRK